MLTVLCKSVPHLYDCEGFSCPQASPDRPTDVTLEPGLGCGWATPELELSFSGEMILLLTCMHAAGCWCCRRVKFLIICSYYPQVRKNQLLFESVHNSLYFDPMLRFQLEKASQSLMLPPPCFIVQMVFYMSVCAKHTCQNMSALIRTKHYFHTFLQNFAELECLRPIACLKNKGVCHHDYCFFPLSVYVCLFLYCFRTDQNILGETAIPQWILPV